MEVLETGHTFMESTQIQNEETNNQNDQQLKQDMLISNKTDIQTRDTIQYGDQVIFYESMNSMKLQTIVKDGFFQNKFGYFGYSEIVGKQYGQKLFNLKRTAFIYLLRPDPILLTDTLSHKTQILYQADISMIISKMNIAPGSIVVESDSFEMPKKGTGSASLSSSLARTIQEEGHLYTFEFNESRAKNGEEVLKIQGLKNFDVIWRDVISNGFLPIEGQQKYNLTESMADAVFLDLPRPFEAIGHSKKVLKRGGYLCCFSPCIEQVMRNCEEMRKERFIQITTIEILQRSFERRDRQFQSAFSIPQNDINQKRKGEELDQVKIQEQQNQDNFNEENLDKNNLIQAQEIENNTKISNQSNENVQQLDSQHKQHQIRRQLPVKIVKATISKVVYTGGPKEIKGHTGYLSFGILM